MTKLATALLFIAIAISTLNVSNAREPHTTNTDTTSYTEITSASPDTTTAAPEETTAVSQTPIVYPEPQLSKEDLAMAVPDFLTEEQQMLYRRASNVYRHLFGISTTSVEYGSYNGHEYFENKYGWRYLISQGRYQNWGDFMELALSVFTKDFFNKRNDAGLGEAKYVEYNGKLAFTEISRGGAQFYNYNFDDEFELVSVSDTEIVFYVIGHYSQIHPKKGESFEERDARCAAGWEMTDKFTIRMVMTDSGWRFDEFYDTAINERTDMFIDDLGWY